MKNRKNMSPKK